MTIVERKGKIRIQVSHAPFLLFVGTSILIHGVGLLSWVLSNQNLSNIKKETESTPIDFVIVPPTPEEPPPDTKRVAIENSVAKGKNIEPELPSANNKIDNEEAIATSKSSQGSQRNIQDKSLSSIVSPPPREQIKSITPVLPEPQPKSETISSNPITPPRERVKPITPASPKKLEPITPVKPRVAVSKVPKPETTPSTPITPPRESIKPLAPVLPKPEARKEPPAPVKPRVALPKVPKLETTPSTPITPPRERVKPITPVLPKPEAKPEISSPIKNPVALSKVPKLETTPSTPIPSTTPPRERVKPITPVLPKPQPRQETQPVLESNSNVAPSIKPIPQSPKIPSKKTETSTTQPDSSSVATNLSPKPPVINPPSSLTKPRPVPQTKPNSSSKPKTPVSSGTASLLGGTQRRSLSDDSGSSFFNPKVNASQQALNSRGLDARQNIDLGPYFAEIRRRVRRNWKPSQPRKERHTILVFSIQRNGQITGLRIVQSSGSPINDQESLEAVQKSAPFGALPANFPRQELKVQFNFNIYFN